MKSYAIALLVLTGATVFADQCGCFEIGAEALYWKPAVQPFQFGQLAPDPTPTGTSKEQTLSVNPDYDWGFRIFAGYGSTTCPYTIELGWTHFRSSDFREVTPIAGSQILRVIDNVNALSANARIKTRYEKVNLRGSYCFLCCNCMDLGLYAGARYVEFKREVKVESTASTGRGRALEQAMFSLEAGGLEVGFAGDWCFPCNLSLSGYFGGTVLIGPSEGTFRSLPLQTNLSETVTQGDKLTHCRPGLELRLELAYTYCCGTCEVNGFVGYELDYYFLEFTPNNLVIRDDDQFGVGFGGPFVGLSVRF